MDDRPSRARRARHRKPKMTASDGPGPRETFALRIGDRVVPGTVPLGLTREQCERLAASIHKRADAKAQQAWNWVVTLAKLAVHISELRTRCLGPEVDMFWIRLYGLMTEITPFYKRAYELSGGGDMDIVRVYGRCLAVQEQLSEDELLYLEYFRHNVAHVWQQRYELGRKPKKGTLQDTRYCRLIDKTLGIEELEKRLLAYIRPYQMDTTTITIAWADRLVPYLQSVVNAMRPLYY